MMSKVQNLVLIYDPIAKAYGQSGNLEWKSRTMGDETNTYFWKDRHKYIFDCDF